MLHASLLTRHESPSNHFTRQRHDLHEVVVAELAGDGAEDAGAPRVVFLVDHDGRITVEADVGAVLAPGRGPGADDDAADHLALLDLAAGQRLFHGADDHVADAGDLALELALATRPAEHLDAHRLLGAGVVGDVEIRLLLDHCSAVPCHLSLVTRGRLTFDEALRVTSDK